MSSDMRFRLLTPSKEVVSCSCDSVNLFAKDDRQGKGGGSVGIRRGHLPAVIALEEGGPVRVTLEGKTVFSARISGGFARVDSASVTVLTPEAEAGR